MLKSGQPCSECGAPVTGTAGLGLCSACALREAFADSGASNRPGVATVARSPEGSGDYELLDEIARGGMGVVYRARQRSLNRVVALKVLLGGAFAGEEGRRRLKAEAAAAARLKHPNIVAVHASGELDGQPFYSMDFVAGRTLADVIRDGPLPARRAVGYLTRIAGAVEHAHEQGVLHRDLKPANVLIDSRDEPQVTDFGLARIMDNSASGTLSGAVLGSPAYMPPEQAAGRIHEVSAASDVYALGAVLYEMLTGRPPFFAESPQAVIELVKASEPVAPRQLNASVPVDLETVCLKCLEKDPARRYPTARLLRGDLERFTRGEPVLARPISPPGRFVRWCRRHPALAAVWCLIVVLAIGSSTAALWIAEARNIAVVANERSRQSLYEARLAQARAVVTTKRPGQRREALAALEEAAGIRSTAELRDVAIKALSRLDLTLVNEFAARQGQADVWKFHPSLQSYVVETAPGVLEWRTRDTDKLRARLDAAGAGKLFGVPRFDSAGRHLATQVTNGALAIWSLDPASLLFSLPGGTVQVEDRYRQPADFSPAARRVAIARLNGGLSLRQLPDGGELGHRDDALRFDQVHFSPDGRWLVAASHASNLVQLLNAESLVVRWQTNLAGNIGGVAWRPDGRELAVGLAQGSILLLAAAEGTQRRELRGHTSTPRFLTYAPDGQLLWSRGGDSTMRAWSVATGEEQLARVDSLPEPDLTLSTDGREMIFSQEWTRAAVVQLNPPTVVARFAAAGPPAPGVLVGALAFSSDSQWLAFTTFSGVTLVNVPQRKVAGWIPAEWSAGRRGVEPTVRFAVDGRSLFFCQRTAGLVRVPLDVPADGTLQTGEAVVVDPEAGFILSDLSADGRWLALTQRNPGALKIIDTANGTTVKRLAGQTELFRACFSPDRQWLVTQTTGMNQPADTHPALWSIADWSVARQFPVGPLGGLSFSGDGRVFAVAGQAGFKLYSTSDWHEIEGLPDTVRQVDGNIPWLSADGQLLAVGVHASVHLIAAPAARPLAILPPLGDNGEAARPCLSPDGRTLAVLCDDGTLDLWDLVKLRGELAAVGLNWSDR